MKKQILISSIFLAVLAIEPSARAAFGKEGHGGLAWVCRNQSDDGIRSVEFLDLVEARTHYGIEIAKNGKPAGAQVENAWQRISDPLLNELFDKKLTEVKRGIQYSRQPLPLLPDAALVQKPIMDSECNIEQLAIFYDDGVVEIVQKLYDRLDAQAIAALYVHETLYYLNRSTTGAERSMTSRELTGRLFADRFDPSRFKTLADRHLPTISQRLLGDPLQIKLSGAGDVAVQYMHWPHAVLDVAGARPVGREDGMPFGFRGEYASYARFGFDVATTVCVKQNNIPLVTVLGGSAKYRVTKGCFKIFGPTTFLLVP